MITLPVQIPQHAVAAFCERSHIRKLLLFGSVLTERSRDKSDVDMLVEFEPSHVPGLIMKADDIERLQHMLDAAREAIGFVGELLKTWLATGFCCFRW